MRYEQITFERKGRVGLITLSRPEKLNAGAFLEKRTPDFVKARLAREEKS